jgi:hypothetical protein
MPTEIDVKLAADLADSRVETERRFGALEKELAGFRSSVETELGLIRKLGDRLLGVAVGIIGTMIVGAATVAWAASAVVADVRHQGERIDKVDTRLDAMGKQLETLLNRTAPKSGARNE